MDNIKEHISNLKFISKINPGDKIDTVNMFRSGPSIFTSLMRTLRFDNRLNTLKFINATIQGTFELLEYLERSNSSLFDSIVSDLHAAEKGLENLKETYSDDVKFQCDIDTLLQIIRAKVEEKCYTKFIYQGDSDTVFSPTLLSTTELEKKPAVIPPTKNKSEKKQAAAAADVAEKE
jgi:hypothetical protein